MGAIIEDKYPNIFCSKCLVPTLNLLMHDLIKLKENESKWIGELYKKGKHMIRFITNHRIAHGIFCTHSKLELLKIAKTRFASSYLTFRHLLKVKEALASMVLLSHLHFSARLPWCSMLTCCFFYPGLLLHGVSAWISTASFHFRALLLIFSLPMLETFTTMHTHFG